MTDTASSDNVTIKIPRTALLAGGGIALVGVGLAAGLMLRHPAHTPADTVAEATVAAQASAPMQSLAELPPGASAGQVAPPTTEHKDKAAGHRTARAQGEGRHEAGATAPAGQMGGTPTGVEATPAVVCANCGVIEAVRAVQQKGQGSGVGAVAGGLLGGVVGNQMGKGSGKTAMTVLGAIGGGIAGNEIEKSQRTTTMYEVKVRMDDGSVRTFTQSTEPVPGTRVQVDGRSFHPIAADSSGRPATMQTATQGGI